jgi:L-lactate dehydrogenase complex protein LldE
VQGIAERVFELTEFLVYVCRTRLPDRGGACRAVLHTSCSARREMGTHHSARALLGQCAGVDTAMQEHESECCGFGGTFSVRHPHIAAAMAADKADALEATGAQTLISADAGCLLNINGTLEKRGSALRGEHIATFLWRRTGSGK